MLLLLASQASRKYLLVGCNLLLSLCAARQSSVFILLCDAPAEHDLGCDGAAVSIGTATDMHGQDPTVIFSEG